MSRVVAALLLLPGLFFGWVFYVRHWRWRGCFNELGRCWDAATEQVLIEEAGLVWGGLSALALLGALLALAVARRPRQP